MKKSLSEAVGASEMYWSIDTFCSTHSLDYQLVCSAATEPWSPAGRAVASAPALTYAAQALSQSFQRGCVRGSPGMPPVPFFPPATGNSRISIKC